MTAFALKTLMVGKCPVEICPTIGEISTSEGFAENVLHETTCMHISSISALNTIYCNACKVFETVHLMDIMTIFSGFLSLFLDDGLQSTVCIEDRSSMNV